MRPDYSAALRDLLEDVVEQSAEGHGRIPASTSTRVPRFRLALVPIAVTAVVVGTSALVLSTVHPTPARGPALRPTSSPIASPTLEHLLNVCAPDATCAVYRTNTAVPLSPQKEPARLTFTFFKLHGQTWLEAASAPGCSGVAGRIAIRGHHLTLTSSSITAQACTQTTDRDGTFDLVHFILGGVQYQSTANGINVTSGREEVSMRLQQ